MLNETPFFAIMLVIGLFTSIEDIKTGKIRNFWIVLGLLYSLVLYLFVGGIERPPLGYIAANLTLSLLIAYALWKYKYWFAGDAKLFFLFAILLPAGSYRTAFLLFFPSFHLLSYTFILAAIYLLILSLADLFKGPDFRSVAFHQNMKECGLFLSKSILGFAPIFLFNQILWNKVLPNFASADFANRTLFLLLFFVSRPMNIYFGKHRVAHYVSIAVMLLILLPFFLNQVEFVAKNLARSVFYCLILIGASDVYRKIINNHISRSDKKTMPFAPWLFLGILTVWFLNLI